MTGRKFMAYMIDRVKRQHAAYIFGADPGVEFYDGNVRISDWCGEALTLKAPVVRHLRQLATMLELAADEMERREFER